MWKRGILLWYAYIFAVDKPVNTQVQIIHTIH